MLQSKLSHFTGTSNYYYHWLKQFVYTDGVKYLVEQAKAYWLIDAIASHQPQALKDPMLRDIQFWKLTVANNSATLYYERDTNDVAITQQIPFTEFPLPNITLYLTNRILLLPSEY